MSISSIGNSASPTDSRSAVKQSGTQAAGNQAARRQSSDDQSPLGAAAGVDAVSISAQASDLQALENTIKSLPDVDVSRVNAVREQVNSGSYEIDSQRVADKIIAFEKSL